MSPAPPQTTGDLLKRCIAWLERFAVLSPQQKIVIAVWVLHTWAIEAAEWTPYLHVTAPEKGCGKSQVLEALEAIVCRPCKTSGITPAALLRIVDTDNPTLLLDEFDATLGGNKEMGESLRGILDDGAKRGGCFRKCNRMSHEIQKFNTFGAKAIAGIGKLQDTVASRSIAIEMQRKIGASRMERSSRSHVKAEAEEIRAALQAWATPETIEALRHEPSFPEQMTNRQMDISEPLLAIADLAGGVWPEEMRAALVTLFSSSASEDSSIGVELLKDIRGVFNEQGCNALSSAHLADALCQMEGQPWAEWKNGKGLNPTGLARQLKKYGITSRMIRFGPVTVQRGYTRDCFKDTWERYCQPHPVKAVTAETSVTTCVNTGDLSHEGSHNVTGVSRNIEGFAARRDELLPSRFSRPVADASRNVSSTAHVETSRQSSIVSAVTDATAFTDSPALPPESFNPFI